MAKDDNTISIINQISKQEEFEISPIDEISLEELKGLIASKLETLINQNFEAFLRLMYRLDVSEVRVRDILTNEKSELIPISLAELVIEREQEKIYWRKKYSS